MADVTMADLKAEAKKVGWKVDTDRIGTFEHVLFLGSCRDYRIQVEIRYASSVKRLREWLGLSDASEIPSFAEAKARAMAVIRHEQARQKEGGS